MTFSWPNNHITCTSNRITHTHTHRVNILLQLFLYIFSIGIFTALNQSKSNILYKMKNPLKFLMQYFQRKNNFLNLFLAYLVHKHYIAMYWAHHNNGHTNWLFIEKNILFVSRTFTSLHLNIMSLWAVISWLIKALSGGLLIVVIQL